MHVLITGASGLVGAHAAGAILRDGSHTVRVLARDPQRVLSAIAPLGVECNSIEIATGDVTDAAQVAEAMRGVDAVIHAAGLFSHDPADTAKMQLSNVLGTRCVLGAAVAAGADPIIHVSSYLALFPPRGAVQRASDPVTAPRSVYARTKAEAESIARELQESGAPVVTVYPGAIHGPDDPSFGASPAYLAESLRKRSMLVNRGGRGYNDVRDLARLLLLLLAPGRGPRRMMCGGLYTSDSDIHALLCQLTGNAISAVRLPGWLLRAMGRTGDIAAALTGGTAALSYEAACVLTRSVPCDDTAALALLGRPWMPIGQSLCDLLVWMRRAGHLSAEDAGPAICALAAENRTDGR